MSTEAPTSIGEFAEFAADILADARRLRDGVTDLENDGMEIRAVVDAVDHLYASAGAAARALAAVVKDFENLDDFPGRWNP